jgi:Flp pilus assembly pilin Flp
MKLKDARLTLARLYREDEGQDLIEYVLIFTVVGLGAITGVHGVAAQVSGFFNIIKQAVASDIGAL